jgi:hypothetical protein
MYTYYEWGFFVIGRGADNELSKPSRSLTAGRPIGKNEINHALCKILVAILDSTQPCQSPSQSELQCRRSNSNIKAFFSLCLF